MVEKERCPVCERRVMKRDITLHHYLPRSRGGELEHTMRICKTCHDVLHYHIPLHEVHKYDSPEILRSHDDYNEYIQWIRSKDHSAMYKIKHVIMYMDRDKN